ncbi:putative baseplate protein [Aeromonas phage CF8]|nr:putative baseplate protein [Aeromonas phage CF8]
MNVLECYGIGTVLQDKETDTDEVLVHCPAIFSGADGEAVGVVEETQTDIKTPTGDATSSGGLSSNGIPCKWLAFNTNRVTAPDVRKGSQVVVYKFKGTSEFRWMSYGLDGTFRLETIVHAFSSSPNTTKDSPLTPENFYILLLSTHTGKVQFLTGQGNGEKAAYVITLDTKEGIFSLTDSEENLFALNSVEHVWNMSNQDKSVVAIDKKKILLNAEDQIVVNATESMTVNTKVLNVKVGETFNLEVGQETNMTSPTFNFTGNFVHTGNTQHTGDTVQTGKLSATGAISSDTDCISAGKSGKDHRHSQVQRGDDESGSVV